MVIEPRSEEEEVAKVEEEAKAGTLRTFREMQPRRHAARNGNRKCCYLLRWRWGTNGHRIPEMGANATNRYFRVCVCCVCLICNAAGNRAKRSNGMGLKDCSGVEVKVE